MAPKKKTARPSVVEAPAELSLAARGEAQIQLLRDLNTRLMKEIKQLRSDLASSAARSDAELRRANEQLEAERAVASDAMEKLIKKAEEKNLKTAEAAGLKLQLEEKLKGNELVVLKCNTLKLKLNDLAAEKEHLEHTLITQAAMIGDLSQNLELTQSRENRRRVWNWVFPLATVAIAAGALAYANEFHMHQWQL